MIIYFRSHINMPSSSSSPSTSSPSPIMYANDPRISKWRRPLSLLPSPLPPLPCAIIASSARPAQEVLSHVGGNTPAGQRITYMYVYKCVYVCWSRAFRLHKVYLYTLFTRSILYIILYHNCECTMVPDNMLHDYWSELTYILGRNQQSNLLTCAVALCTSDALEMLWCEQIQKKKKSENVYHTIKCSTFKVCVPFVSHFSMLCAKLQNTTEHSA